MGACDFYCVSSGESAQDAFMKAAARAKDAYGRRGYTGTIAEKDSFVLIPFQAPEPGADRREAAMNYAEQLLEKDDPRIRDKYGPAGCIVLGSGEFLFFGVAPE